MDLWKHKHEVNKKKIKKQCGFTLVIMPHYQGKTVRIVLTPLRIYTAVLSIALLVVFAVSSGISYRELIANSKSSNVAVASVMNNAQIQELQILQDELSKTKADVEALKQYCIESWKTLKRMYVPLLNLEVQQ